MIKSLPKETFLNVNSGMISYVFHRISGLAICLYLFLHIYTLSAVWEGNELLIIRWQSGITRLVIFLSISY